MADTKGLVPDPVALEQGLQAERPPPAGSPAREQKAASKRKGKRKMGTATGASSSRKLKPAKVKATTKKATKPPRKTQTSVIEKVFTASGGATVDEALKVIGKELGVKPKRTHVLRHLAVMEGRGFKRHEKDNGKIVMAKK